MWSLSVQPLHFELSEHSSSVPIQKRAIPPKRRPGTNETTGIARGISLKQPRRILPGIETRNIEEAEMIFQIRAALQRSQERARHRRSYKALLQLEDHFLRDIGLSRNDVAGLMSSDRYA